jgi:hypothetical protein
MGKAIVENRQAGAGFDLPTALHLFVNHQPQRVIISV